jgi:hypothetical protein
MTRASTLTASRVALTDASLTLIRTPVTLIGPPVALSERPVGLIDLSEVIRKSVSGLRGSCRTSIGDVHAWAASRPLTPRAT